MIIRAVCLMLTAVATVGWMPVAQAQLASGYSGASSEPIEGVAADYWILLRGMGTCAAKTKSSDAAAFMQTLPASAEEGRAFKKLFGGKSNICLGNFVRATFIRAHVRGAVAEGLYERFRAPQPGEIPVSQVAAESSATPVKTLHDFARCYVGSHRVDADRLLRDTRLGTKGEDELVGTLAETFGGCLPANREVKLKAFEVRMALAEALYHSAAPAGKD